MTTQPDPAPIGGKRARRDGPRSNRRGARRVRQATPVPSVAGVAGAAEGHGPDWWHRDHPVFSRLTGFFTGLLVAVLVPTLFGVVLGKVVGYDDAEKYFGFVLLVFVVPLVLIAVPRTRRFGLYFLIGLVATIVVAVAAAVVTLLVLTGGSISLTGG